MGDVSTWHLKQWCQDRGYEYEDNSGREQRDPDDPMAGHVHVQEGICEMDDGEVVVTEEEDRSVFLQVNAPHINFDTDGHDGEIDGVGFQEAQDRGFGDNTEQVLRFDLDGLEKMDFR